MFAGLTFQALAFAIDEVRIGENQLRLGRDRYEQTANELWQEPVVIADRDQKFAASGIGQRVEIRSHAEVSLVAAVSHSRVACKGRDPVASLLGRAVVA